MSRISGIVRFDGKPVQKNEIQKMLASMPNCSNDGEGIWVDENIGFAHKMLWTTPESVYENQPLISKDGNLILTADARIDNRKELIEKLALNKDEDEVITDSDLILYSYEKWGEDCPKYLMGDFAFSIWDKIHKKLFMTRDRFGIKPFYFYIHNQNLYFSSYINVLMTIMSKPIVVNNNSVKSFGKFSTVKYEETMYDGILRIPPAFSFTFVDDGLKKLRYWFPEKIKINYRLSFEEAKKNVTDLLRNAVKSRLRVYGDFAFELSGGLDSTAIALLAKDMTNLKFKTFSMRYLSYSCDEWNYTKEAIDTLKSTPVILDVDQLDLEKKYHLYKAVHLNKHWPLYGSFMFNYVLGEKMVENGIRVCLTGHGGDHVFTGSFDSLFDYLKHFRLKYAISEFKYLNESFFSYIYRKTKASLPENIKSIIKKYLLRLDQSNIDLPEDFIGYWDITSIQSDSTRSNLVHIVGRHHVTHCDNNHYRILESNEPLEFRHPFFDTELIEYLLSLPNYYKFHEDVIKVILREVLKDLYPTSIYNRKDKAEFSEALLAQMNTLDMKQLWENSILVKNHLVDESSLAKLLHQYEKNSIDAEGVGKFWRMITLELWLKENQTK